MLQKTIVAVAVLSFLSMPSFALDKNSVMVRLDEYKMATTKIKNPEEFTKLHEDFNDLFEFLATAHQVLPGMDTKQVTKAFPGHYQWLLTEQGYEQTFYIKDVYQNEPLGRFTHYFKYYKGVLIETWKVAI